MNGISEVFLIRNQMVYLVERLRADEKDLKDFYQNWELLDGSLRRAIGDLERSAMSMRMMTVQGLFSRMARVVQSYRTQSNKQIEFKTEGEDTEFDKKVLDTLGEPLVHLVRNAMDHGVETPEERLKQGKAPVGSITLKAEIAGNDAVVQIRDDGRGMDPKKILASAQRKGIDVSHVNDDKSAIDLIFLPGFSTAEKVSDISGRGVGMDAVKTSISVLGGTVSVDTKLGQGSTFTVRIPVTMSLVPVVLVNINGLEYAVPNSDILEVRNISSDQVRSNAGKDYVLFRGSYIPCIDLRKKVRCCVLGHEEKMRECSVIVFRLRTEVLAAQISSFDRNTEIIIKPLSRVSPKIPGVTGVSVLPTGEPIFVLSLSTLFEAFRTGEISHAA
jgi:two-component system chemotaxis sensor kinase CheA